jgi:threonine/homoserine efflux transporter RhtA
VFASALCGAVCSVLYRPFLRKHPTLSVSGFAMLAVVFIGVNSGIGYYLWLWALDHSTPTKVTVFLALSPITAALLGAVFLAERLSTMSLLGLACVALGKSELYLEPTHSPRFLALMDRFVPTWRAARELLNRLPARHELRNY